MLLFLAEAFGKIESHDCRVREVILGKAALEKLPKQVLSPDEGSLWGAPITPTKKWVRILALVDNHGKSHYFRVDPSDLSLR